MKQYRLATTEARRVLVSVMRKLEPVQKRKKAMAGKVQIRSCRRP